MRGTWEDSWSYWGWGGEAHRDHLMKYVKLCRQALKYLQSLLLSQLLKIVIWNRIEHYSWLNHCNISLYFYLSTHTRQANTENTAHVGFNNKCLHKSCWWMRPIDLLKGYSESLRCFQHADRQICLNILYARIERKSFTSLTYSMADNCAPN